MGESKLKMDIPDKMKHQKPIAYLVGTGVGVSLLVAFGILWSRRGVETVQTARVTRPGVTSVVTASGEVRPKNYVHISANAYGRIVAIFVKEGDQVRKGQELAKLESIQPEAEVRAQRAQLAAAKTDIQSAEAIVQSMQANLQTAQAELLRAQAQLERSQQDFSRAQFLHEEQLISRASFEQAQADYKVAVATVRAAEARNAQAQAQLRQAAAQRAIAHNRVRQARANLERLTDQLSKHTFVAPLDGVVTDLPMSVGENVVLGIQNAPGSLLMTIADLSVITTEVLVDETDIAGIRLGQKAKVEIDAFPNHPLSGEVTEIGNTAVIRATGLAAAQSTISSQQAKDFKVVITLANPMPDLRPGLSATAEIITDTHSQALAIPLQALTIRLRRDLGEQDHLGVTGAATSSAAKDSEELEGVFVIRDKKAFFQPVTTGISGITDIEVLTGPQEGDEIVTGSYEVLRSLKSGARVRIENHAAEGR